MAKFNPIETLDIQLPHKHYPIIIGQGLLKDAARLRQFVMGQQVFVVTNETIAPLYLEQVKAAFAGLQCDSLVLPDGEAFKDQAHLTLIYDELLRCHHHRDTTLVALGGGVIGDLTGFAAATYQRGTGFIQLPTSLLAQVDASVGGKTAINHPQGKNMIGSFYQPDAVLIDLDTLQTLPLREFRAGLAEVIKYGLLVNGAFLTRLDLALQDGLSDNKSSLLPQIIYDCCQIKANIVQQDEREAGNRALLNLGHTIGHALEAQTQYQRWLHGEAVAIGLYCAALLSHELNGLNEASVRRVERMLKQAKLPTNIPQSIDQDELLRFIGQDKKIKNNQLRFILMRAIGDCYLDNQVTETILRTVLQQAVGEDS